ncbi:MAG TPA: FkbM family methyltransferase [Opitutaceae bacterium]
MSLTRLLRPLKTRLLGEGARPRRIRFGAARGLVMQIDPSGKTQRILGLDEREIQPTFVAFARWAEVLVDIGASDGYYSLIFHRHNPRGAIHLIDANPVFAPEQRAHFAANFPGPLENIQHHTRFVAPPGPAIDPGKLVLSRDLPLRKKKVLFKIDVDGWELDILRSAEALLPETECRFLIETHSVELERDCQAFLEARGFAVTIIPNAWWRLFVPECRPIPHNRWLSAVRR